MSLLLDRNLVLAAGAGSGKTHALCTVTLGLYLGAGGRPPLEPREVYLVTFTDKAAAELRLRVAARVRALALGHADREVARLLEGRAVDPRRLAAVAAQLGAAPIGTFHSLATQLLRRYAAEAGVDPRFTILDEGAAGAAFTRARERTLRQALADGGAAARRLARDLGGLRAMRQGLDLLHEKLAEEGRSPWSLVEQERGGPRPFADVAAARVRLEERCAALGPLLDAVAGLDEGRLAPHLALLERERVRLDRLDVDHLATWYPVLRGLAKLPAPRGRAIPAWRELSAAIDELKAALGARVAAEGSHALVELLVAAQAAYDADKRAAAVLDFADLIRRSRDLLRDDRAVRGDVKRRLAALLVDEFQDTNRPQLELVHLLAEARDQERPLGPGASPADLPLEPALLCVVGDRKQSIYDFRGADVTLFGDLAARARRGDALRLATLDRSHRSRPPLVEFGNRLFRRVFADPEAGFRVGWRDQEDALSPVRVEAPTAPPAVELIDASAADGDDGPRRLREAARVADWIAHLLGSGRTIEPPGEAPRPVQAADVAVLLRAFTGLDAYRAALAQRGIASLVVGGRGFHGAREVRDLAALLMVLADPGDRFASAALLRSPLGGLPDDALALLATQDRLALRGHARGCDAALPDPWAEVLDRLGPLVGRLSREVDRLGPAEALRLAVGELDLLPAYAALPDGAQRVANLRHLLALLGRDRTAGAASVARTLLALADDDGDREPPGEVTGSDLRAVRILTVHAAKGLEFPVVVLPELARGEIADSDAVLFDRDLGLALRPTDLAGERLRPPHAEAVAQELQRRGEAESRRLFYVAVTRARDLLALCGEGTRRGSWRQLLEEALPDLAELVVRVAPPPTTLAPEAVQAGVATAPARELVRRAAAPPALPIARLVATVTDLAAFARCPRRYFYRAQVGLEERLVSLGDRPAADEGLLPARERGTLAHLLLERVEPSLAAVDPTAALVAALAAEGLDPAARSLRELVADGAAFLASPFGRRVAAAPPERRWRELPFALEIAAPSGLRLQLKGQIDLLFVDGDGTAWVVDYKHVAADRGDSAWAFQIATYALAARRVLDPQVALRAALVRLRDRGAPPAEQTVDRAALDRHQRLLGRLGDQLAAAHRDERYPKLPSRSSCGDCGYVGRCFGATAPEQLPLLEGGGGEGRS